MPVSIKEAQRLADKRQPIPFVKTGDGCSGPVGPEVYGRRTVRQLDRKGGWTYLFEATVPVPVEKAINHPKGIAVRADRRRA